MANIAVLSSDDALNSKILKVCSQYGDDFTPVYLRDKNLIIQYLKYELPEINVFNCNDHYIKIGQVVEEIQKDPWLHYGSVIVIHDTEDGKKLAAQFKGVNILALIRHGDLDFYFSRLLRMVNQNRAILFQRDIHSLLKANISGAFAMGNDPFDMTTYSNLLANFLFNSNLISHEKKETFYVALMELLINAIEHGNCQISYQEKSEWHAKGGDILELIREKNKEPEIAKLKVYLTYKITPNKSTFTIKDEGDGFDWHSYKTATGEEGIEETHGRGISIATLYMSQLAYNDKGNEVRFEIEHKDRESNLVPQVFTEMEEAVFEDGQVVFRQGERSSFIYYIVSGKFDIIANEKTVSTLTSDDLFLGEMSFLLNNRRSATVRSVGRGVLIKISKEAFINAIKENPHYGFFLARLLAQRLDRLNLKLQ